MCFDQDVGFALAESWYSSGELHRTGYVASIIRDQTSGTVTEECWYQHGKLHRLDGPAVITRDGKTGSVTEESWLMHGLKHRDEGPATILYDLDGSVERDFWFRHGERIYRSGEKDADIPDPAP